MTTVSPTRGPGVRVSLTPEDQKKIYERVQAGELQAAVASDYGISQPRVNQIVQVLRSKSLAVAPRNLDNDIHDLKRENERLHLIIENAVLNGGKLSIEALEEYTSSLEKTETSPWTMADTIRSIQNNEYEKIPSYVEWINIIPLAEKAANAAFKTAQAAKASPPKGPSYEETFTLIQRITDFFRAGLRCSQYPERQEDFEEAVKQVEIVLMAEMPEVFGLEALGSNHSEDREEVNDV